MHEISMFNKAYNSSVGIALGYELDDRCSRVRFPARAGNFSLHHRVQNSSGAQPASYPICTRGSFPGVKRPGNEADHSSPSSTEVKECVELYLQSPNTPSWCGAQLKKAEGQLIYCPYHIHHIIKNNTAKAQYFLNTIFSVL
jgi:hypothetical protein